MDSGLADVVSGAIGGIASLFGADSQSRNVKRTNEMNYKIAKETNQMSWDIANANNAAQLEALKYNNAFNRQQAIDMFNMEADYNNPVAQKERLLAAGLNPATMYGNGSASVGNVNASTPSAASSGISPSMPSLVTPTMQTPPSVINSMFGNIESFTRSLGNLANSKLSTAQKDKIETMLGVEFENAVSKLKGQDLENAAAEFNLSLDKLYKSAERDKELHKKIYEMAKLHEDALLAASQNDYQVAQTNLSKLQKEIEDTNLKILKDKAPFLVAQVRKENELLDEKMRTEKSNQFANYAQGNKLEAETALGKENLKFLEDTHEDRVDEQYYKTEEGRYKVKQLMATFRNFVDKYDNETWISYQQARLLKEIADKAEKENESYYGKLFVDILSSFIGIGKGVKQIVQ